MDSPDKRLVFRTLPVIATAVATVLTIVVSVIQLGAWVNAYAVWILWAVIVLLSVGLLLLSARSAAIVGQRDNARAELAAVKGAAMTETAPEEGSTPSAASLSTPDRALADELYAFASDSSILRTLGEFFPYQIPRGAVSRLETLAQMPITRSAHNPALADHFASLTDTAQTWLTKLAPLVSMEGDDYTTRLQYQTSEEQYQKHSNRTDELSDVGLDLHERLLAFQRYYASL